MIPYTSSTAERNIRRAYIYNICKWRTGRRIKKAHQSHPRIYKRKQKTHERFSSLIQINFQSNDRHSEASKHIDPYLYSEPPYRVEGERSADYSRVWVCKCIDLKYLRTAADTDRRRRTLILFLIYFCLDRFCVLRIVAYQSHVFTCDFDVR